MLYIYIFIIHQHFVIIHITDIIMIYLIKVTGSCCTHHPCIVATNIPSWMWRTNHQGCMPRQSLGAADAQRPKANQTWKSQEFWYWFMVCVDEVCKRRFFFCLFVCAFGLFVCLIVFDCLRSFFQVLKIFLLCFLILQPLPPSTSGTRPCDGRKHGASKPSWVMLRGRVPSMD